MDSELNWNSDWGTANAAKAKPKAKAEPDAEAEAKVPFGQTRVTIQAS